MKLTVLIPAHNEEKRVSLALRELEEFFSKNKFGYSILIIDDGKDLTAEIVKEFSRKDKRIKSIHFPKRIGKGAALTYGMKHSRGTVITYDADAAVSAQEIAKLLKALEHSDLAIGSRAIGGGKRSEVNLARRASTKFYNFLTRRLFGLPFRDTQCGFKALNPKAVKLLSKELESKGLEWDVELLARARMHGLRIAEVPVNWKRIGGGPIERSKIRTALRFFTNTLKLKGRLMKGR